MCPFPSLWFFDGSSTVFANTPRILLSPTATLSLSLSPTPIASAQSIILTDPTIWAAVIASVAAIIAGVITAVIAGAFALSQMRRTAQIEKERQEVEKKRQEEQFRHDEEIARKQREHDEEMARQHRKHNEQMARKQKELEVEYKVKEQAQLDQIVTAEARRLKMLLAPNSQRTKMYRESLHADPRISQMQILDMTRPLDVSNIYIRVRVHQETRSYYELDSETRRAELQRDPNALIQARFHYVEQRSSNAMDPDEAIRTYKRCVFVGDPGAGKTTLLKYLTLKAADGTLDILPDLPIRVELNAFVTSGYHDLLDYVSADWDERYGFPKSEARTAIEEQLKDGNALLLLDALDETVVGGTIEEAEQSYQQVTEMIQRLATRYPQIFIVVTARKAGYQQRSQLTGFTELEVLDFRSEDIQVFVTKWFDSYTDPQKKVNGNELNAKLMRSPRIQALAANPLLLSLIVLVYEAQLDLPERRAELYKRCTEVLLREWDAKRNIRRRREFRPEHKQQLLGEIAWHFHLQGKRYFPEAELLQIVADFLPTIRLEPEQNGLILAEIANEHGLLKEQAKGWHGFLHLSLQEYFVAQYITDHQQQKQLLSHCGDPWWEEVMQLHAGLSTDISPLLHTLLGDEQSSLSLPEDIFHTNLITAGRCLAASPTIKEVVLWKTVVERLFEVLVTTPYALMHQMLAEGLIANGSSEINLRLISLLSNKQLDSRVRMQIADAIGELGERAVAPTLVSLLSNEQLNSYVRGRIADAIGKLGERTVAPMLVSLLSNEQLDPDVRMQIADALGILGERTVAPTLVSVLSNRHLNPDVQMRIADALGKLGEHMVAPTLISLLFNKQLNLSVRMRIADALGELGECTLAPTLVNLLSNEQLDSDVRTRVALAIGKLGERTLVPTLVSLLSNRQLDSYVRMHIADAIGELGERTLAPTLVGLLSDEQLDSRVRGRVALTIGELGERTLVPILIGLLSKDQLGSDMRMRIILAIGKLGERTVAPMLVSLLSNEQLNLSVRMQIADAIGELGERTVAPTLVGLLSNEQLDSDVRMRIVDALGKLGERVVAPMLVSLLSNEQLNSYVRMQVADSIGELGERTVVPSLLGLLSSDEQLDSDVRKEIVLSLQSLVDREEDMQSLLLLLPTSDIADQIYQALWVLSLRMGVRIIGTNTPQGEQYQIVKWSTAP